MRTGFLRAVAGTYFKRTTPCRHTQFYLSLTLFSVHFHTCTLWSEHMVKSEVRCKLYFLEQSTLNPLEAGLPIKFLELFLNLCLRRVQSQKELL